MPISVGVMEAILRLRDQLRPLLVMASVLLLCPTLVFAQAQAGPSSRIGWDMNETDATTLVYFVSVDSQTPTTVMNVTCTPGVVPAHACIGDLPALMVGQHDLTVSARRTVDGVDFDGLPSMPLSIVFAALPSTPVNLRLEAALRALRNNLG